MSKRIAVLDYIKVTAATLIVAHHYEQGTGIDLHFIRFFGGIFNFGYVVGMFFLISGYLSYHYEKNILDGMSMVSFVGGRVRHLSPMLMISVIVEALLCCISCAVNGEKVAFTIKDVIVNGLGLRCWGLFEVIPINYPAWYVSVLLLCYLVFGVCVRISKKFDFNSGWLYALLVIWGVVMVKLGLDTVLANSLISKGLFSFFLGLLLAKYMAGHTKNKRCQIEWLFLLLPVAFVLGLNPKLEWNLLTTYFAYVLLMWLPILIVVFRMGSDVKNNGVAAMLSAASFEVYIWNEPLCVVRGLTASFINLDLCKIPVMIGFIVINWMFGIFMYHCVETSLNNFLKGKIRISKRK